MANLIAHVYIAKQIQKLMPESMLSVTQKYQSVYNMGSMGSDVLYGLREIGDKDERYANEMHALKIWELFSAFAASLKAKPDELRLAYVLGYMSHYVTDRNFHPYVAFTVENYLPRELPPEQQKVAHTLIETASDTHVLRDKIADPKYKLVYDARMPKRHLKAVAQFYVEVVNPIYNKSITVRKFRLSKVLILAFLKLATDPKGRRKRFWNRFEDKRGMDKQISALITPPYKYGEIDYLNFERRPYRAVRNEPLMVQKNIDEIIDASVTEGLRYMQIFMKCLEGTPLVRSDFDVDFEGVRF